MSDERRRAEDALAEALAELEQLQSGLLFGADLRAHSGMDRIRDHVRLALAALQSD